MKRHSRYFLKFALTILVVCLACACVLLTRGCGTDPWESFWSSENTLFTSYNADIRNLDSAIAYYEHELYIVGTMMEAPLAYKYLTRPYALQACLAEAVPDVLYFDKNNQRLPDDAPAAAVARGELTFRLKEGVRYQPHPCFALTADGRNANDRVNPSTFKSPLEFPYLGTREVTAEDLRVAVIRICDPRLSSPIFSTLNRFIAGMEECSQAISKELQRQEELQEQTGRKSPVVVDYRSIPFSGIEVLDKRTWKLHLQCKYPQIRYWLAMTFFAPIPQEAVNFYSRQDVIDAGFTLATWPVGTGAFMMTENTPQKRIVVEKNPNFREEFFPTDGGTDEDRAQGVLDEAGKKLPLADRIVFNYEREALPVWVKFQQGYYDSSGIPSGHDSVLTVNATGDMTVGKELADHQVRLLRCVKPMTYYIGFNMLDSVVGGMTPQAKKLRQALSIALDFHEYTDIFSNGRDIPAQSIIPPNAGISGACDVNPVTDERDPKTGKVRRQSLDKARALLAEAGYPAGIGQDGNPLTLYYDVIAGSDSWKTQYQWMRKCLEKIGVVLEARPTDSNRNREKLEKGNWQIMIRAWIADYPDPENFLFIFYSENGKVRTGGSGMNYTNYASDEYDEVFKQLETLQDGPEREALVARATEILQNDAPMVWGFHRSTISFVHHWLTGVKLHSMATNMLKYHRVDGAKRKQSQILWNKPILWPIFCLIAGGSLWAIAAIWRRRQR